MNRLFTALAIVLFLVSCAKIKPVSDAHLSGFKGKIKYAVKKYYYEVEMVNGGWQPVDTADYTLIFYEFYNQDGFYDSIWFSWKNTKTNTVTSQRLVTIFENGIKKKILYYEDGEISEEEIFEWVEPKKYIIKHFNKKNKTETKSIIHLEDNLFELKGETVSYSSDSSVTDHYILEFQRDSSGFIKKTTNKNLIDNTEIIALYLHSSFDPKGYPLKTIAFENAKKEPKKIILRETTYY